MGPSMSSRPTFRKETMFGAAPDWSTLLSPEFTVAWSDPT